jgi:hypothetical protein
VTIGFVQIFFKGKSSQVWWCTLVVSSIQENEEEGLFQPVSWKSACATQ